MCILYKTAISTKGALRVPTTNDNHSIHPSQSQWLQMTTNDYQWLPMTTYDYQWLLMTANDCQWLPMTSNDYQWLPMTTVWLHSDYHLTTFSLHFDYILTTFWRHYDYFWLRNHGRGDWSSRNFDLDYHWSKKIYRPKMIVRSGAIIHPFSDLVNGRFPPQEAINLNKYTFYKKKFHKVPPLPLPCMKLLHNLLLIDCFLLIRALWRDSSISGIVIHSLTASLCTCGLVKNSL